VTIVAPTPSGRTRDPPAIQTEVFRGETTAVWCDAAVANLNLRFFLHLMYDSAQTAFARVQNSGCFNRFFLAGSAPWKKSPDPGSP
jgi:hypothetical protein